jgi:hypothetical protein
MKPQEVVRRWPKWGAAWAAGAIVKVKAATIATAAMVRFMCPRPLSTSPLCLLDISALPRLT